MAIGRLVSPKLTPHFNSRGFLPLTRRWLSSSLEDGRKFERLSESEASTNKDIGQKGMRWNSFGGLLTNLKQKIMGNVLMMDKSLGEDSPKSDVTVTKVVSLQNVAENKNCISSSVKEESSVSEVGSQDVSQSVSAENENCITSFMNEESSVSKMGIQDTSKSVVGIETSEKRERISVNEERLDNINRLDGLEFVQEKALRGIQAERVDPPQESSSTDVSAGFLTEEILKSFASSGKIQGKMQPEKRQSYQARPPQNSLSKLFINSDLYKEVKLPLSNSNLNISTGESCSDSGDQHGLSKMFSDPVLKTKSISKENNKHRLSDALQNPDSLTSILLRGGSHDQKSGDLAAIKERKSKYSFESSSKTGVPVGVVSRELSMKKVMDSFNLPTDNGTGADAITSNLNGGEGKCVSKGNSVTEKSDRFCETEEEESKAETFVMENQSVCSQATANPKVIKESLFALSAGEHSPNNVLLRFLQESVKEKEIAERFSEFGTVLDVQVIPSCEGCIYKDALVTFETNSAAEKALKKVVVTLKNSNVVIEATSQEDMVERLCIPDLIGDPDVPIALVKEPTRTVKIHPLTHDLSSNQIKEALRFCGSNISKFMLGSSRTDAFVEFETEDGKDKALEEHSISIDNTPLFISRIDIPRTTVARISNLSKSAMSNIRKLCLPYGQIKQTYTRGAGVVDVCFDVSEWPNMLTILNSLNGMEMDGKKLVVRPATTVIPPAILRVLWKDPQEKRYVKSVIKNLVREIEQPLDATRCYKLMTDLLQ